MSERPGKPRAAMAIWAWREEELPETRETSAARKIRLRGAIQGGIGLGMAALVYTFLTPVGGWIIATIAGTITLAALISPEGLFAGIEAGFRAAGRVIGRVLTWGLLSSIFYGFFLPFGGLFRRGAKDSMKRFYDPDAPSYWSTREPRETGIDSYKRQY